MSTLTSTPAERSPIAVANRESRLALSYIMQRANALLPSRSPGSLPQFQPTSCRRPNCRAAAAKSDKPATSKASSPSPTTSTSSAEVDDAPPPMGWLWQTNRSSGNGSGSAPSASTTVANLKQDRIKPKK